MPFRLHAPSLQPPYKGKRPHIQRGLTIVPGAKIRAIWRSDGVSYTSDIPDAVDDLQPFYTHLSRQEIANKRLY